MEICQERRKANPNIVYNSLVTFWNSMTESESFFKTTKWSFLNQAALLTTARELEEHPQHLKCSLISMQIERIFNS